MVITIVLVSFEGMRPHTKAFSDFDYLTYILRNLQCVSGIHGNFQCNMLWLEEAVKSGVTQLRLHALMTIDSIRQQTFLLTTIAKRK